MKNGINRDLQTYLMGAASTPWEWGRHDCCTLVADWCAYRGHPDPMGRWRDQYSDEPSARKFIADAHGIAELMALGMIDAAIPECDLPEIGDVGIVTVMGEHGPEDVGAIYLGRRWAMRSPNGLFNASVPVHAAWRVG